jgi:hypothetical protein
MFVNTMIKYLAVSFSAVIVTKIKTPHSLVVLSYLSVNKLFYNSTIV